jgi:hypothetical protein
VSTASGHIEQNESPSKGDTFYRACVALALSIEKRGTMIPIYVSDATSHIDKAVQNSACLGGERERGASMRIKDRKYG